MTLSYEESEKKNIKHPQWILFALNNTNTHTKFEWHTGPGFLVPSPICIWLPCANGFPIRLVLKDYLAAIFNLKFVGSAATFIPIIYDVRVNTSVMFHNELSF